jgi:hypothetical protein
MVVVGGPWGAAQLTVKRAFLSSTGRDLGAFRHAVFEAVNGLDGWKCVRMEDFGARARPIAAFDADAIARCELFLGILGHRYGEIPDGHALSYTEQEYDAALALGLPRLMFLSREGPLGSVPAFDAATAEAADKRDKQARFRERVRGDQLAGVFSSPDDLAGQVVKAIHHFERQDLRLGLADGADIGAGFALAGGERASSGARVSAHASMWLAAYLDDLLKLLSGPRRFVVERQRVMALTPGPAVRFFLITMLVFVVPLYLVFLDGDVRAAAADVANAMLRTAMFAAAFLLSWRLVTARFQAGALAVVFLYHAAVFNVLFPLAALAALGALAFVDRDLAGALDRALVAGDTLPFLLANAERLAALTPYLVIDVMTKVVLLAWLAVMWSAARAVLRLSWARAAVAGLAFAALALLSFVTYGLWLHAGKVFGPG